MNRPRICASLFESTRRSPLNNERASEVRDELTPYLDRLEGNARYPANPTRLRMNELSTSELAHYCKLASLHVRCVRFNRAVSLHNFLHFGSAPAEYARQDHRIARQLLAALKAEAAMRLTALTEDLKTLRKIVA